MYLGVEGLFPVSWQKDKRNLGQWAPTRVLSVPGGVNNQGKEHFVALIWGAFLKKKTPQSAALDLGQIIKKTEAESIQSV